jgi:hypothetical protein
MNWLKGAGIAVVSGIVALAISQMIRQPAEGQAPAMKLSRTADGKPDLNGIWQAMGTAHWDLQDHNARSGPVLELGAIAAIPAGLSVVEGNEIPYQPWAAAKKKENYENWLTRDPEVKCYLPGIPRATYMPYPFQIVQTHNNDILMAYEYASASRVVKMGKTDTIGFNDETWFDRAGNFHSDALHVVERFAARTPDLLDYQVTIEDPKVFTRPWKIQMPLYRRQGQNAQLLEFKCVEFVEELMYGNLRKKNADDKPFAAARMRWP